MIMKNKELNYLHKTMSEEIKTRAAITNECIV